MIDIIERRAPWIVGGIALCSALFAHRVGLDSALGKVFELKDTMSAAFNVIAFATPLAIGLLAIALSPGGGFIEALHGTKIFSIFVNYTLAALLAGSIGLLVTLPYLTVKSTSGLNAELDHFTPLWWAVTAGAFTAIARVILIFMIWARSYAAPKSAKLRRSAKDADQDMRLQVG